MKKPLSRALVVIAAVTCTACGTSGTAPPGTAAPELEEVAATGPAAGPLTLGPRGVGPLRLGMTHREVLDTGVAYAPLGSRHDGWRPGCRVLQYRPDRLGRIPGDTINGALDAQHGLERMYATRRMVTPEGVRLGSTVGEVREAYDRPGVRADDLVTVRASRTAVYRIHLVRVVVSISLERRRLDCTV